MLRRTKDTLVNGLPIVELPPRIVNIVECEFDAEEQAFYDTVEQKVRSSLDDMEAAGTMKNNYTIMLVLLLRLRQGTCGVGLSDDDMMKRDNVCDFSVRSCDADIAKLSQGC